MREIEVTVAQIELDRRAADCDGLRRGYGLTPWGLEGFCDEDLRDQCGGCGETKSGAKEMAAGEQQVLRSASMRAVFHDWTLAEVGASRKFGSRVWEQKCRYFLGVRWYSFGHDKFECKDCGCFGLGVCSGSVALRGAELSAREYGEPD